MEPSPASPQPSHPPSHIILFRRPSERNAALVAEVMGGAEASVANVGTHLELHPAQGSRAAGSVYTRLGVAAADLTPDEADRVRESPDVALVIPNRIYTLPPYTIEPDVGDISSLTGVSPPAGADPMSAFLLGLRSAADAALAYRGRLPDVTSGAGVAAAAAHGWPLDLVKIPAGYGTATGRGIKVAVLDTGVDRDHPDLGGSVNAAEIESFVPGETAADGNGHGTHCAGVVGGAAVPTQGDRYGVAPGVELLIGKVLNDAGKGSTDQILKGVQWAADRGARIISMSIQILRSTGEEPSPAFELVASTLLAESPGVLLIAAAGNASSRPLFTSPVADPAACKSVLAVAAIDRQKRIAPFSCAQMDAAGELNCAAPGVGVRSAWPGGTYRSLNGTSMAAPHVAGLAALWLERNPGWTSAELWRQLEGACVAPNAPGSDFGRGLAQAP